MIEFALKYRALKWPVVPCSIFYKKPGDIKATKKPIVNWKGRQSNLPSEAEIRAWWTQYPDAQIGVLTGPEVGLLIVDIDLGATDEDIASLHLPASVMSETPTGGRHIFLRYPVGHHVRNSASKIKPFIDIRATGGFAVLPPSVYPDGRPYGWLVDPEISVVADCPLELLKLVTDDTPVSKDWAGIVIGKDQGGRNQAAVEFAGYILRYLPVSGWNEVAWPMVRLWNRRNRPPLDEYELLLAFNSIAKKEYDKRYAERIRPMSEM